MSLGHNNPPPQSPFEIAASRIDDLMLEAQNWLDGEPITMKDQSDGVSRLLSELRVAAKHADETRKAEAKPVDDAKAEIQARYKPILAKADLAADTCKKALAPYLKRVEDENRAKAEALRLEADAKAKAAQEALRASSVTDISERIEAEKLIEQAKKADQEAKYAEAQKAHAKGGIRAVGLTSVFHGEIVDMQKFANWIWLNRRPAINKFLEEMAYSVVRSGERAVPGLNITEERVAK